jgi:hypothetical protein
MTNIYDKENLLLFFETRNFTESLFTEDASVLKQLLLSDKSEEPELLKFIKKKHEYSTYYYIDEHANIRGTSNSKYTVKQGFTKRDTSNDMGWRKGSTEVSKPVQNQLNIIKLPNDRKTSNDFTKGSKLEEVKPNPIPEESKQEEKFDIKIIFKVNEFLKYPNHEPLWYILHPVAKSSFGPLSSNSIEEMWNNKVANTATEIRFIDIFHIRNKLPFIYFKLSDIEGNEFKESIELNPLIKTYSHVGQVEKSPVNTQTEVEKMIESITPVKSSNMNTICLSDKEKKIAQHGDIIKNGTNGKSENKLNLLFGPKPVKAIPQELKVELKHSPQKEKPENIKNLAIKVQVEEKKEQVKTIASKIKPEIEKGKENNTIEVIRINSRANSNFRRNSKRGKSRGKLVDLDVQLGINY